MTSATAQLAGRVCARLFWLPFLLLASGRNSPNSILILIWRITGPYSQYSVGFHTTDRDEIHAIGYRCRAGVVAAEVGGTSKYFFVFFNFRQEEDDDARKRKTPLVLLSPSRSPNRNDSMPSFRRRRVKRKRDNDKKRTSLERSLLFSGHLQRRCCWNKVFPGDFFNDWKKKKKIRNSLFMFYGYAHDKLLHRFYDCD